MVEVIPPMSSAARQLTSWKEIADYLGVNVRTAQKWERARGLPVRRVPGARSRVSADTTALEAWKQRLASTPIHGDFCYRWPLGHGLTVEVRFIGTALAPVHIGLLCQYLKLVKTTLTDRTA